MRETALDDKDFMAAAIAAARKVEGNTGDNPPVGAVIVSNGKIIAQGATQPPGGHHAEVMAIQAAEKIGVDLSRCDFYVTLEPCTFQGRTPPCSALLVSKHPRRVVVGIRDPHPKVCGQGIAELKGAGIEVEEGILSEEITTMLASWLERFSQPA